MRHDDEEPREDILEDMEAVQELAAFRYGAWELRIGWAVRGETGKLTAEELRICERARCRRYHARMKADPAYLARKRLNSRAHYWARVAPGRKRLGVVFQGERRTLSELARAHGLKVGTVWLRLKRGWDLARALQTPAYDRGVSEARGKITATRRGILLREGG